MRSDFSLNTTIIHYMSCSVVHKEHCDSIGLAKHGYIFVLQLAHNRVLYTMLSTRYMYSVRVCLCFT